MRKSKIKAWLRVFLPFVICFVIQVYVGALLGFLFSRVFPAKWIDEHMSTMLVVVHVALATFFGIWYFNIGMDRKRAKWKEVITAGHVISIACISVGLYIIVEFGLYIVSVLSPEGFEKYSNLMQQAGIGETSLVSVIAVVLLAPIGEECIFRGITLYFLEQTKVKFLFANVLQALLFGIMHGNLMQGTYAFILGLILGYIAHHYSSIWLCIWMHFIFNLCGSFASVILNASNGILSVVFVVVALILGIVGFIQLLKEKPIERTVEGKKYSFLWYRSFTTKWYRRLIHILFPSIIAFIGAFVVILANGEVAVLVGLSSILIMIELWGDFFTFSGSIGKDTRMAGYIKSSFYGRKLFRNIYCWDLSIKLVKLIVVWLLIGGYLLLTGKYQGVFISFLVSTAIIIIGANFVRRLENIQTTFLVTIPCIGLNGVLLQWISALCEMNPGATPIMLLVLLIVLVAAVLTTYKLPMRSFERSFGKPVLDEL